jgi:ABC-type protease/lipase transport system fused ATPase/permease subunit
MAQPPVNQTADALLKDAIEAVMKTASGWIKLLIGLGLLSTVLGSLLIYNQMYLIRSVPLTQGYSSIESALTLWVLLLVVLAVISLFQGVAFSHLSRFIAGRLGVPAVLATAQRAGRPEAISSSTLTDLETVRTTLAGATSRAVVGLVVTPLIIPLLIAVHWWYAVVAVFYCLAAALLSIAIARANGRAAELNTGGTARAYGLAADAMRSGEAVMAMGMLPRLIRLWVSVSTEAAGEAWFAQRRAARLTFTLDVVLGLFRGTVVFLTSWIYFAGGVVNGTWAGAMFLVFHLITPFVELGSTSTQMAEGMAAWRRLRALVAETSPPADGIPFPCPHGQLTVEHMSFAFRGPQPPLLRNVELTVEPGSIIAIVGQSGSGKSTLLRILVGLLRPSAGGVYLDGHATSQWDRRDFARHVGFLPQQPLLSRGTAAEVIARLEEPDMELVLEAARRGGAHDVIAGLPNGYATPLSGTYQLSMGQRHRIALARALYGRPKLLLLDELAGSMDSEGEAHVAELLQQLREEGTSVIFTTHRPSLVAVADRVLALRNGTLVPAGEELPRLLGVSRMPMPQRQAIGGGRGSAAA